MCGIYDGFTSEDKPAIQPVVRNASNNLTFAILMSIPIGFFVLLSIIVP